MDIRKFFYLELTLLMTNKDEPDVKTIKGMNAVFIDYPSVKFYYVSDGSNAHDMWREHANFNQMRYAEFISYCDI